ncbi:unnamed protein product [Parascedosporium putredinis]|uniref:Heterokaryon incompatibility domain-containing protein n=1 Tax=Parascedosporium putredinis TaxID=1442378 RepID=A0A9P1HBY6_9PEZI|nr:unnamed protein product [Parascedosporium putredinis]CAI8004322.1 unnamed protein product [Parascedosporium putredinis]
MGINSTPEVFKYQPLDPDRNQIRLLRILKSSPVPPPAIASIRCEIFHINLDEFPIYNALSYTWGSPTSPKTSILLDDKLFLVRENLWMALKRLESAAEEMVIWIDAICINQESIPERNSQVPKMTQIYRQAHQVVSWLGVGNRASALAFKFVEEFGRPDVTQEWALERLGSQRLQLQALSQLFQHEYWNRMWVLQELTVAKSIIIYCGTDSINGETVIRVQRLLINIRGSGLTYGTLLAAMDNDMIAMDIVGDQGLAKLQDWTQSAAKKNLSFLECLLLHSDRAATDARDMIYGLANIANEKSKYKVAVDYALSTPQLYTDFARTEIEASETLLILTRARLTHNTHSLPSWVPDWSAIEQSHAFLLDARQPQFYFKAGGSSKPEVTFSSAGLVMTTKAIVLGSIKTLGKPTNMTSDKDLDKSALAFWNWWSLIDSSDPQQHETFAHTILARKPDNTNQPSRLLHILGMFSDYVKELYPDKVIEPLEQYWQAFIESSMNRRGGLLGRSYDMKIKELERDKQIIRSWRRIFAAYCWDRRFFISSSGRMGLAPDAAEEGDVICIP